MRASHDFSEREAWVSTNHTRFVHPPRVVPAPRSPFPLLKTIAIVLALIVAAKYATPILKANGWL